MCDEHFVEDLGRYVNKAQLTRRKFGQLSASVGLAMLLPPVANAQAVSESDVEIQTPDGVCDAYFVHPSSGAHAAVLCWPD
ncbi:MAG: dienelactone hydrolase family protein, partial [Gammaproteobacteria bacterium]